jgi:hypothetical protein
MQSAERDEGEAGNQTCPATMRAASRREAGALLSSAGTRPAYGGESDKFSREVTATQR